MLKGAKNKLASKFSKERLRHVLWRMRHFRSRKRAARTIAQSELFDPLFIERYYGLTDVTLSFFLSYGRKHRLSPHPLFDIDYFFELYPELELVDTNHLLYFLENANANKLSPHPLFDTKYYLASNPDVARCGMNALSHFVRYGAKEGRNPHPLFDTGFYLATNPDVRHSGINPLTHFVEYGWRELRNPHPLFDCRYYLHSNPDIVASKLNPLIHFLQSGAREDRNPHLWFNVRHYKNSIREENLNGVNPLIHYLEQGAAVVADPHPNFSSKFYLSNYSCEISPLLDYVTIGFVEGRHTRPKGDSADLLLYGFESMLSGERSQTKLPLISVLLPTYNTPVRFLQRAIGSVLGQSYNNWELCICDDCSSDSEVIEFIKEIARRDSRVKFVSHQERGHISRATNSAFELSSGDYITLLDHDDELTSDALQTIAGTVISNPEAKLIYSDEDYISEDNRCFSPHYKLDWNYDLFLGQNYLCHLTTIERSCFEAVGGLRATFEGAQDWDLFMRVSERIDSSQIVHIPRVLYHWRVHQASTASGMNAKPYASSAQIRTVESHLQRKNIAATVNVLPWVNHIRVRYMVPQPSPSVKLFLAAPRFSKQTDIKRFASEFSRSDYPGIKIEIINSEPEQLDVLNSQMLASSEDIFIVLGSLGLPIEVDWIDELVSRLFQTGVGAVGAKITGSDGRRILEAGLDREAHGHIVSVFADLPGDSNGPYSRAALARTVAAVGISCLATSRASFCRVGGFDVAGHRSVRNDVAADYCLRLSKHDLRTVFTPFVEYQVSSYCEELSAIDGSKRRKAAWPEGFGRTLFGNEI